MPRYDIPLVSDLPPEQPGESGRRRVVIVTNPSSGSLEYMGPIQVIEEANLFLQHSGRSDLGYDLEVVARTPGTVFSRKGFTISADIPYSRLRGEVDTLIFQAVDEFDEALGDERFISWVARMSGRVRRVTSICTGAFILAQAGVLDGRRATTHWCVVEDFRARYPNVTMDPDPIYVKDGHVYTSAGASSGMDLTIALIEEDFGSDLARKCAQGMVMYLRRPGNQAQFSVHLPAHLSEQSTLHEIQTYVSDHLDEDLRVEALAQKVHMSPRNFTRVFTRQIGMTPGRFVEQCRIEHARQWLERSETPVAAIAKRCGYGTPDGMRLAFDRHLGVSPREYRRRFTTSGRHD